VNRPRSARAELFVVHEVSLESAMWDTCAKKVLSDWLASTGVMVALSPEDDAEMTKRLRALLSWEPGTTERAILPRSDREVAELEGSRC
jgi:hypothetical protein